MFRHAVLASLQSAFIGCILFTVACIPFYGGAATLIGVTMFPFALFFCIILSIPLMKLRIKFKFSEAVNFVAFVLAGLFFGASTVVVSFGTYDSILDWENIKIFAVYGLLGCSCSISAWNYLRINVPYSKTIE